MAEEDELGVQKAVATLVAASTPVEALLLAGTPLSEVEHDTIENTLLGLQTALEVWKRKNGLPVIQPKGLA